MDGPGLPPRPGAACRSRVCHLRRRRRHVGEPCRKARPDGVAPSPVFEPTPYVNNTIKMFEHLRNKLGFDVELLHDVHERVPPVQAIQLAKAVEPYRLFFLEDPFAPEDAAWFQHLRQQTSTPLAMGELFVNRHEWLPLVTNRWIDFIRLHISAVGGLNMARKVVGVLRVLQRRTAWHGPGNVSPVGHAVNMHLDLASYNFGIQEQHEFSPTLREIFPGCRRSRGATCTRMISRASASTSTRRWPRGSRTRRQVGTEGPIAAWTAR